MSKDILKRTAIVLVALGGIMLAIGFLLPPVGDIPESVIKAFGEIIGVVCFFGAWSILDKAIDNKTDASVKVGNTEISVNN